MRRVFKRVLKKKSYIYEPCGRSGKAKEDLVYDFIHRNQQHHMYKKDNHHCGILKSLPYQLAKSEWVFPPNLWSSRPLFLIDCFNET